MPSFTFGQPVGALCQLGYIVEDIHRSIDFFSKTLHAGPWFYMEDVQIKTATYRGKPMQFRGSLAAANTGHTMIELIHQSNNAPSVFTEVIEKKGYGLHHQAIAVRDFDAQVAAYEALGYEEAFYAETDMPNRSAYFDTRGAFPFFLEVIEATDALEGIFNGIYQASVEWNGEVPIRPFSAFNDPTVMKIRS